MTQITFDAPLTEINSWTILHLPLDESKKLPSRSQVMVEGTLNGTPFQAPLEPDGNGGHWLHVDKKLQKAVGAGAGDTVTSTIQASKVWPEPEIPKDLKAALDANPTAYATWQKATPMAHWEWLRWINSTKVEATYRRHIEVSISKLTKGMRRPCCFNRSMCCVPDVSKGGVLLQTEALKA